MEAVILVGIGGAIGSMLRYTFSRMSPVQGLPSGTLAVNVTGSFMLSLLTFSGITGGIYELLCTGMLGGFTTMSSFGFETFRMIEDKDHYTALANIILNVVGSLMGIYIGYMLLS
ncbi:chromosome condensation protein CrcB [Methanocella sp. CWC-04]|uniref:Fluoride-specific ion channel FluC n=1 Tax=Methanooceanicella nereidis TaxID=2052831 RepID=A0AAP2W8I4_9EURY|nr:CrcB family protein [Methanocella sp. CWC-04]MCD1296234.1 chromosome condensation protein CrcB [Methanocella sp. CWC-04]